MKIAYLTDSGSGESSSYFAKDGIISLPLQITDGVTTWQDMENFSKNDCIKALGEKKVLMTSQPSLGLIEDVFDSLEKEHTDLVISVPICSGLSGTSGTLAACAGRHNIPLLNFDTYTTCVIQDWLIHRIKQMKEEGKSDLEIGVMSESVIDSCETMVVPVDLKALARGGRLTKRAAMLGSLLRITPILHLNKSTGGRIDVYDKTISLRKAARRVVNHMKESPIDENWLITIAHTNAVDTAENFYHAIQEAFPSAKIQIIPLCNVVSAQAGLGCIGIEYFREA